MRAFSALLHALCSGSHCSCVDFTNLLSFSFSYDDLGRLTSSAPTLNTLTKATDNYGYDPTSRVTSGPITGTVLTPFIRSTSYDREPQIRLDSNHNEGQALVASIE